MLKPPLLRRVSHSTQVRLQHPRSNTPNLHPIGLQLVLPIQHEHIECALAATVRNGLEICFWFGPASWLWRRGEVLLAGLGDAGEAGDEDEAGVGGLEE